MDGFDVARIGQDFLFGFGTLFSIINPFGLCFVFLERTATLTENERRDLAIRIAVMSFSVILVSLIAGSAILGFFGISLPALRIAGGLVVAVAGWQMVNGSDAGAADASPAVHGPESARRMAFFPLTIPLTTGPGTIAAAIALGAKHPESLGEFATLSTTRLLIPAAVALTIYVAYRRASMFSRLLGGEGTTVVTKISAFLLLCVGVQIILTGVSEALGPMLSSGSR